MLITKNSRLLQIIAFQDFVYFVSVVSGQFISFVTKMKVVARIRVHDLCSRVYCVFGTESIS